MVNYWLLALPKEKMEFCIKVGVFGLNRKYVLGRVDKGDRVVCYATSAKQIVALGEVTEPYYIDDTVIFKDQELFGDALFPDRINFKAERLNDNVDFIPLIDQMSFIKNAWNWQVHFRSAITQISKEDWEKIQKQAAQSTNKAK